MSRASKGSERSFAITVFGRVQGVGFRPFVYRCAKKHGIAGKVANSPEGAFIEASGGRAAIDAFLAELRSSLPPHARIDRLSIRPLPSPLAGKSFVIAGSTAGAALRAEVPPDLATCPDCLAEVEAPSDRHYRYPFTNCTNCGPRFSIIRELPYDRRKTTMKDFRMCPACGREYRDPADRRFHAQPNACPECGPQLALGDHDFTTIAERDEALAKAVALLRRGKVLAVKSLGGYHLACDARNAAAINALRRRKARPHKAFALMARDLSTVKTFCGMSAAEEAQLLSPQRPIVLLRKKDRGSLATAELLAPGNACLGVMLPYTPLHHLLFNEPGAPSLLVMTSANRADEPLCITEDEAREKLAGIADYFLFHDRPIHNRCDDSIVQVLGKEALLVRRSRGYVPGAVPLSDEPRQPVFAAGAELKNAFCLTRGGSAYLSAHVGELDNGEAMAFYEESIERMRRFLRVEPKVIAHDLHPNYQSTLFAQALAGHGGRTLVPVQHHAAHIAAVAAEHGLKKPLLGFAFDGTGLGTDGNIWGGECMLLGPDGSWQRRAHFAYFPLPGGDLAAREIWRCGVSLLSQAGLAVPRSLFRRYPVREVQDMIERRVNAPLCSSLGRIFDGVAAIMGLRSTVSFEAQAAMEMETLAGKALGSPLDKGTKKVYNFKVVCAHGNGPLTVTLDGVVQGIVDDLRARREGSFISLRFHRTIAEIIREIAVRQREELGISDVAFGGGVFQNRLLLGLAKAALETEGFTAHHNAAVPSNDGGIALGQAWIAARTIGEYNVSRRTRKDRKDR